jgi:signal transduction histidine kinase
MAMYQRRLEADLRANQIELENLNRELENRVKRMLRTRHLEVLGRMTGGIIHDFNSLLLVIRNQCEALGAAHPELQSELAVINKPAKCRRLLIGCAPSRQSSRSSPPRLTRPRLVTVMVSIRRKPRRVSEASCGLTPSEWPAGPADPVQLQQP